MAGVIWVKHGWADFYQGDAVDGNYAWIAEGGEGHEAFNFLPAPDGRYYGYVPPQGRHGGSPYDESGSLWTVVFLAKHGNQRGVHIVGWYEDAQLVGKNKDREAFTRPEYEDAVGFRLDTAGQKFSYSIVADKAFLVLPEDRTDPISHPSIKQSKYSYLLQPGEKKPATDAKAAVLSEINKRLAALKNVAVAQPNRGNVKTDIEDESDPLINFGTAAQRKKVEMAAEAVATSYLIERGYTVIRRADEKVGYDLQAIPQDGGQDLYVEVKGTSSLVPRFFMTPNELAFMTATGWRFALVTDALGNPAIEFLECQRFKVRFDLQPGVWVGKINIA
jgi:hypothetical protein